MYISIEQHDTWSKSIILAQDPKQISNKKIFIKNYKKKTTVEEKIRREK